MVGRLKTSRKGNRTGWVSKSCMLIIILTGGRVGTVYVISRFENPSYSKLRKTDTLIVPLCKHVCD